MSINSILSVFQRVFRNVTSQLAVIAFILALLSIVVVWFLFAGTVQFVGGMIDFSTKPLSVLIALFSLYFSSYCSS
jgi:hypothetical protein